MIDSVDEVLRPDRNGWKVVTKDPVLAPFLSPGGDYVFFVVYPRTLDEDEPNSGNLIAWRVEGDAVVLTHADTAKGPICRIERTVLEKVIALLAKARGDHA